MKVVRFVFDVVMAVVLSVALVAIVLLGYGRAMVGPWEMRQLAEEVDEGAWVWVDEQPIYYRAWGPEDGRPVVLVSGLDVGGSALWSSLGPSLGRAGYYTIALDTPPLGESTRDVDQDLSLAGQAYTLAVAMNELGVQDALVMAQGWGSTVALQIAAEQPQLVGSLVLVGPLLEPGIVKSERFVADLPLGDESVAWLVHSGGPIWRAMLRRQVAGSSTALDTYVDAAREASHIEGTVEALAGLYALEPSELTPTSVAPTQVSCVIVRGEQDQLLTVEAVEELAFQLGAQVHTVEGAGHLVPLDDPTTLRQLVESLQQP